MSNEHTVKSYEEELQFLKAFFNKNGKFNRVTIK